MKKSRHQQQKRQSVFKESSILCKHCGKQIFVDNYLIHEARCELMRSRAYLPEELERHESKNQVPLANSNHRRQQSKKEEVRLSNEQKGSNRERSRIFQKRESQREEEVDKIPCHFCGYLQTFAELDTHPLKCEHREQECSQCGNKFPKSLMAEHYQICRNVNRRPQEENNRNQRAQRWMQWMDVEQDEQNYNPFGNFSSLFMNPMSPMNPRRQRANIHHHNHQNGFQILESDGRGNYRRQVIMVQPQGLSRDSRGRGYQNPYSPLTNFFAMLEMMAGRHANQNQGLTKEQIKNLKRSKYQGNNAGKKEGEKDLCTICYCEFEKDEKLVELNCKHCYHEECITKWVQKTAKCPVCKAPQTKRPIFEEEEEYM